MFRPLDPGAWSTGYVPRALPWSVAALVTSFVSVPLLAIGLAMARTRWTATDAGTRLHAVVPVVIAALVVHGWLAVLLVRSEAALDADPDRMLRAATAMTPAHYATVQAIPGHHALLRERLGPGAAPPLQE
jgi:hypothetical protein